MSYVFVSHAAPDKLARVKPLVHALALEGITFWLDRPGAGENDFQFPEHFLRRHDVRRLISGVAWNQGILDALGTSSAVLVCLSRAAIEPDRTVLRQEILLAVRDGKAVTCIVDDLDVQQIPDDWGLIQPGRLQSPRVDVAAVTDAVAWLEAHPGRGPDSLPESLRGAWQTVRQLRNDIDAAERRARSGTAPTAVLPSARVVSLHAVLTARALPPALLQRLYRRSLPDATREQRSASVTGLLADLDDSRPRSPLLPSPLVEFAERLGRECRETALQKWVDAQTAADLGARAELRRQLDAEERNSLALATLYVDVDTELGRRQVRWWLHTPDPDYCMPEEIVPIGDGAVEHVIAGCLSQALARADDVAGHRFRLRVALLLPCDLLTRGVDSLPVIFDDGGDLGPVSEPLCRRHPVTLHWRTRVLSGAIGRAVNAWIRALATLKGRLNSGGGATVLWSDTGATALSAAAARLLDPAEDGICLGLGPQPAVGQDIVTCLREGVPCFFWFRAPAADGGTLRAAVCAEFARHRPCDAPTRVGELCRTSPVGGPFGALSVVWDEPAHLPAPEQFASPS